MVACPLICLQVVKDDDKSTIHESHEIAQTDLVLVSYGFVGRVLVLLFSKLTDLNPELLTLKMET